MIKKINIQNLAVFQDFNWDNYVKNKEDQALEFKKINIIYGRNYSGKTTLSRIIRALENPPISTKYKNPKFEVIFDNSTIDQTNYQQFNQPIHVFNEDFIRDNLSFVTNGNIKSFGILGSDNNEIINEIGRKEGKLGKEDKGEESGLFAEQKNANDLFEKAKANFNEKDDYLKSRIEKKALDRQTGIKYKPNFFGDQNYTKKKLEESDIPKVLEEGYKPLEAENKSKLESLVQAQRLNDISFQSKFQLKYTLITERAKILVEKRVGETNKIKELVVNPQLHKWVEEGQKLHNGEHDRCKFCGQKLEPDHWESLSVKLSQHFDEESKKLETAIEGLSKEIDSEIERVQNNLFNQKKEYFYPNFHDTFNSLKTDFDTYKINYTNSLRSVKIQLENKLIDKFTALEFTEQNDYSDNILSIWDSLEVLRQKSNTYSSNLEEEQKKARESLRLNEIYRFVQGIDYTSLIEGRKTLEKAKDDAKLELDKILKQIEDIKSEIAELESKLQDEGNAIGAINSYLNHYFGHKYLELAIRKSLHDEKEVLFEVTRNGETAYHLSEGECSLIAFCYFLAKLKASDTANQKSIIWIDDPISSLDSNHIYFVYSLINSEIVEKDIYSQLFVSTHNLEFLGYLKRLKKKGEDKFRYLIIQRIQEKSYIKLMPDYMKKYVTEFNYLFEQIYKCSEIENLSDENYGLFYNFGNNARKFLEIFLYYKYPNSKSDLEKYIQFFGEEDKIPAILIARVNNEKSHLLGGLERGGIPIDIPEMHDCAKKIIEKISEDTDQFEALKESLS